MRDEPSEPLIELLATLRLATVGQAQSVSRQVRALAGDLPLFDSIWVDALAQARILTPYQATEINGGRGLALSVGPYVLCRPLAGGGLGRAFEARHRESGRLARMLVVESTQLEPQQIAPRLKQLLEPTIQALPPQTPPIEAAGADDDRVWAAGPATPGRTAAEWMVENGRFPPNVVLEIARQMIQGLVALDRFGRLHGDLQASGLILQKSGQVTLPHASLRAIVRPAEGYAFAELQPEAYDTVAPERIRGGGPINTASEVYACGCLWWHLLTGRPPFPGGNTLAKLRSIDAGRLVDVREIAPDTPTVLAELIAECLARDPEARPESFGEIAKRLGPPTRQGAQSLSRCLREHVGWRGSRNSRSQRRHRPRPSLAKIAVVGVTLLALFSWPALRRHFAAGAANQTLTAATSTSSVTSSNNQVANTTTDAGPKRAPLLDRLVQPASATIPAPSGTETDQADESPQVEKDSAARERRDLILPTDRALRLQTLKLRSGQTVRGERGERPLVFVPRGGLAIDCEGVVLENIDFVWEDLRPTGGASPRGMLLLAAQTCELRGCVFEVRGGHGAPPAAIFWSGALQAAEQATLDGGELRAVDCVWRGVGAAIDCHLASSLAIEVNNSLLVHSGSLVRLNHAPELDEMVQLTLNRFTLRDSRSALECRYQQLPSSGGAITIDANDSVFIPTTGGSAITLAGPVSPQMLLKSLTWSGFGSLCAPEAPLAAWRNPQGQWQTLDDTLAEVAGLVRSEVTFAGPADADPANSRATEWQAPLRSTQPPGIGPATRRAIQAISAGKR